MEDINKCINAADVIKNIAAMSKKNGLLVALEFAKQKKMLIEDDLETLDNDLELILKKIENKQKQLDNSNNNIERLQSLLKNDCE